jgi:hypothetical protein
LHRAKIQFGQAIFSGLLPVVIKGFILPFVEFLFSGSVVEVLVNHNLIAPVAINQRKLLRKTHKTKFIPATPFDKFI